MMAGAEVMLETVTEGGAAFLTGSAAGELPGRVLLLVLMGAGDGGRSASSQAHFLQDHIGGTRIEVAVAS